MCSPSGDAGPGQPRAKLAGFSANWPEEKKKSFTVYFPVTVM